MALLPIGNRKRYSNRLQVTTVEDEYNILMKANNGDDISISKEDFMTYVSNNDIDGGDANSRYLITQKIDGGNA